MFTKYLGLEIAFVSNNSITRILHFFQVEDGVDHLLFNLLVLSTLADKTGYVWRKSRQVSTSSRLRHCFTEIDRYDIQIRI